MLLFDHSCVVILCEERFMLATGAPGDRACEGRGRWAAWCGWPAGRQAARGHAGLPCREAAESCRAPRRHRNLARAQDRQGLLLLRSQAGSEGVLTEEEYFVKTLPFCGLRAINFPFMDFAIFAMERSISNAGKNTQLGLETRCQHACLCQVVPSDHPAYLR